MNNQLIIPAEILSEANNFFTKNTVISASRILSKSHASISFRKGSPETYYIVSGIVKGNRAHETKLVYKKRLEETEDGPLSSNCDCSEWNGKEHCRHVAALYLNFHLQRYMEANNNGDQNSTESRPPIALFDNYAVNVDEYGTLVAGAHKLIGAPTNATYSSLQYLLHNKKVVNFSIPDNFDGKLIISIKSKEKFEESIGEYLNIPQIRYQYIDSDGKTINEISLLENLYLYNWNSGKTFNLPTSLKNLIQKIRINASRLSINDLILLSTELYLDKVCEIIVDNIPLSDVPEKEANLKVTINPGEKKSQIDMTLIFHEDEDRLVIPPDFLTMFTFEGGLLSSFRRKKDAYEFIRLLTDYFQTGNTSYKQLLSASSQKKKWLDLVEYLEANRKTYIYDADGKFISSHDNEFLRLIITCLLTHFDEQIFRYSSYNSTNREITFTMSAVNLFEGLPKFYNAMSPFGVTIFYDRNEITQWSSRIKFERRSTGTKWFDLELNVSQDDLQVIKNADLDNGLAFTANGLVMLGKDQKEMLRFMKKYTQFEKQEMISVDAEDGPLNKFILPFTRARIFELFELKKLGIDGALTKEEEQLCVNLSTLESIPEYEPPEHLKDILRAYQHTGFSWLKFLYENKLGACLADDMGLGKTLQAIAFIQSIYHEINRVLVVCPVSILLNWENEIQKFSTMDHHIYHGGSRSFPDDAKIILTSYGVMKRECETTFSDKHFDVMILDEVQHLKNIRSQGAFAARQISADFRICLTGTPVENDLAEFYNIIDLSIPGIWGDLQFIRTTSSSKSRLLARKTASPFILRRTKGQVLSDLPPKIENTIQLAFSDEERKQYEANLVSIRNRIKTSTSRKKYGEILRGLLHLRQNCLWQKNGPKEHLTFGAFESVKIKFLMETLEQIIEEGHQAIVFSQFTTYLDMMQEIMEKRAWRLSRIDGTQTIKTRQKHVDTFQAGKSQVFLISLKAGGVGLNLTAASYVFIMDPWWNPAVEQQAIDRAHRIGQENTLTVYRPIIKDTVEEKVL
ncbi:MAG: DEAD/DEAH box helicase family protein, partial [Bacteriovoracaceae bacterium]|nr:DEAD/DEAH box helicase family protein [Bacteriovoracaceae bacterium]